MLSGCPSQCTVIIPTHNRAPILRKVLDGLTQQSFPSSKTEVLIVNDGSTDETSEMVLSFADRLSIRLIEQPASGVSAARNAGIEAASTGLLLFLDDDVIPAANFVEAHIAYHAAHPEHEAMLLGYVTWHPEMQATPFMQWYGESGALFGYGRLTDGAEADLRYLYFANLSAKTELLQAQGGFNETLSVLEDLEIGHRLAGNGARLFFGKAALGFHYQRFSFQQACDRLKRYSKGLPAFLRTEAGHRLQERRGRLTMKAASAAVRVAGPLLRPFLKIVDSHYRLPGPLYRALYWHYASQKSFWDLAEENHAATMPEKVKD